MALLELPYGRGTVPLDTKSWKLIDAPAPAGARSPDEDDLLRLVRAPTAGPPLMDLIGDRGRVSIIIPDRTRGAIWAGYLPAVVKELARCGRNKEDLCIVVATGMHRPASDGELIELCGSAGDQVGEIIQHDARRSDRLVELGETSRGTPIKVRPEVVGSDHLLLLGYIGFHYFAGFTGGRKSILPGVAALESIQANHRLALDLARSDGLDPRARNGSLEGNPVHEDMLEVMKKAAPAFVLNLLAASARGTTAAVSGDPLLAHAEGCRLVREAAGYLPPEPADLAVVSAGGFPRDIDFVQAHKALENSYQAVREGGTIVLLAECVEGIGSPSLEACATRRSVEEVKACLADGFQMHAHTALSLRRKTASRRVILVSLLDPELTRRMGMTPADSLEEAMRLAREGIPSRATAYVFARGNVTVVFPPV